MGIEGTSLRVGETSRTREPSDSTADALDPLPVAADAATRVDLGLAALFRHSPATGPALRIGVVLDGRWTTRFFREVLEDVAGSDFARLCAVLHDSRVRAPAASGWTRKWLAFRESRRVAAYSVYAKLLARPDSALDPLAPVACDDLLQDAKTFELPLDAAAGTLRDLELDVLLHFGTGTLPDALAECVRYGAWRYEHGLVDPCADGAYAHFRGLADHNTPVSSVRLRAVGPHAVTLCRGEFPTSRTLGVIENRHAPFWGTQHFVIQKLNELHRYGWDRLVERAREDEAAIAAAAQEHCETGRPEGGHGAAARPGRSVVGWAARDLALRAARRLVRTDTLTDWFVGLRRASAPLTNEPGTQASALHGFRFLPNPTGRFLADPFLVDHDGRTWLFVEDYGFDDARGVISCGELLPDGSVQGLRPCLERGHHLSYPSVFWHDGVAWMIPESEQSGTVDLYRAVDFPYRWAHERTLLRLRCVDPTPFRHADRWWLYATHTAVPGIGVMTLLYWSHRLTGPWRLHPSSPVCADVRAARGAGPIYAEDGRLYRPSQDCAERYGRALVLNEVTALTPMDYRERVARRIEIAPQLGFDGLHHYHRLGDWEVVDTRGQAPRRRFDQRPARTRGGSLGVVDLVPDAPRP